MRLQRINIHNVRNFHQVNLSLSPKINVFIGENGSGKTSLLETIYILAIGRSFRSHLIKRVVNHQENHLSIFGVLTSGENQNILVGLEKKNNGETKIKVAGRTINNMSELASLIPLQLINNNSFQLLTSGPKNRRQFIDWGLFHVEPKFFPIWKQYNDIIRQRNAALKMNLGFADIKVWNGLLLPPALMLNKLRQEYLELLQKFVFEIMDKLLPLNTISISYHSGWPIEQNLGSLLDDSYDRDKIMGYTHYGPHRADIIIKIDSVPAQDVLSRGHQKLLVSALSLAQGAVLHAVRSKPCLYLIDDLSSELDPNSLNKILEILINLDAQLFITSIDSMSINKVIELPDTKLFHVKQGIVYE